MAQSHVLIVDDDPGILGLSQVLVARQGLGAHMARNGEEALEKIRGNEYSAILLDLFLPRVSGIDIIREIRANHPHLLSRIIIVTATNPAVSSGATEDEIWRLLRKPFDIHEFMSVVSACATFHGESETESESAPNEKQTGLRRFFEKLSLRAGARRGIVSLRSADDALSVRSSFGYPQQTIAEFSPIPASFDSPISAAFREHEPVWVPSFQALQQRYPDLASICHRMDSGALAATPLICGKEVVGAMGWSFSEAQTFDTDQKQQLVAISREYQRLMTRIEPGPIVSS